MKINRYIIAIISMMLTIGMYSQSASATDVVLQECMSCHNGVVVDKVAVGDEGAYWLHSTQTKRQVVAAVVSAKNSTETILTSDTRWITSSDDRPLLITADYATGFKSRPGWKA